MKNTCIENWGLVEGPWTALDNVALHELLDHISKILAREYVTRMKVPNGLDSDSSEMGSAGK